MSVPLAYVTLGTNDPATAKPFYAALIAALGGSITADYPDQAFCCALPDGARLWITRPHNGGPAACGNGVTIGIATDSEARVRAAHLAGLAAGGHDEGAPGPRPIYGPEFFGGYLRDLDGNKLALVHFRTDPSG